MQAAPGEHREGVDPGVLFQVDSTHQDSFADRCAGCIVDLGDNHPDPHPAQLLSHLTRDAATVDFAETLICLHYQQVGLQLVEFRRQAVAV